MPATACTPIVEIPAVYSQKSLPPGERSPRTYLERLAGWSRAGRCVVLRIGKTRALPRDVYDRLITEDSENSAFKRVPVVCGAGDADLGALGLRVTR